MITINVDPATGKSIVTLPPFVLSGHIPFALGSVYNSSDPSIGLLGSGWRFSADIWLKVTDGIPVFHGEFEKDVNLPPVSIGEKAVEPKSGLTIENSSEEIAVYKTSWKRLVFRKQTALNGKMPLDRIQDKNGNLIRFYYEGGRMIGFSDTLNRRISFDYEGNKISRIQMRMQNNSSEIIRLASFRYNTSDDLAAFIDAAGFQTSFSYENHLMVNVVNPLGGRQFAQYDENGRCMRIWFEDGSGMRMYWYDDLRRVTRLVDAKGYQTLYRRSDTDLLLEEAVPTGESRHFYYGKELNRIGHSNLKGDIVRFDNYDAGAGVLTRIEGNERINILTYQQPGQPESSEDYLGNQTAFRYDDKGNLLAITTPMGSVWQFTRTNRGVINGITSPEGRQLTITRNEDESEVAINDEVGPLAKFSYDRLGRLVEKSGAAGFWQRFRYDAANQLVEALSEKGERSRFEYDALGKLTALTTTTGRKTSFQNDKLGRLTGILLHGGKQIRFAYDREQHTVSITSPDGAGKEWERDWQGKPAIVKSAGAQKERYSYQDGGSRITSHFPDGEIVREYDPFGNLVNETASDGGWRKFTYNPDGTVQQAENGFSLISFEYDPDGRVISEGQEDKEFLFGYDRDGNLISLETESGHRMLFQYDRRNRLTEILDREELHYKLEYAENNYLAGLLYPNGLQQRVQYDRSGRLHSILWTAADGQSLLEKIFSYDQLNRLSGISDSQKGAAAFSYDEAGRVLSVTHPGSQMEAYRYDTSGRLLSSPFFTRADYAADGKLLRTEKEQFEYDANGFLSKRTSATGVREYRFNLFGQLTSFMDEKGDTWQYEYDAFGRRVAKSDSAGKISWRWLNDVLFSHSAGEQYAEYLHFSGVPLAGGTADDPLFFMNDFTGKPVRAFNRDGQEVWHDSPHSIYGATLAANDISGPLPLSYPGHYGDKESGLYFTKRGMYDPQPGRLLSAAELPGLPAFPVNPLCGTGILGSAFQRRGFFPANLLKILEGIAEQEPVSVLPENLESSIGALAEMRSKLHPDPFSDAGLLSLAAEAGSLSVPANLVGDNDRIRLSKEFSAHRFTVPGVPNNEESIW